MENLTLLNVFFNDYDVTWLVVILGIYGFCALCRIDNAIESEYKRSPTRIVKMTVVLLLLSVSTSAQSITQRGDGEFTVNNLGFSFDTTKLIFVRSWMEINDSTTTEPIELFFHGRNSVNIRLESYGDYYIKYFQKKENGDIRHVDFSIRYFANVTHFSSTIGLQYANPIPVRD